MSTILEKSNQILNEKNTKILPENLKKGISFFDVAGTLEGVNAQSKEVTPSTSAQEIIPDAEYNALSSVNIKAVDNTIDSNIVAENIKEGISILGISGNYKPEHIIESTGVKLFETIDEMNSSIENEEGDLALVYRNEIQNVTVNSQFQIATFPDTVVLDTALTGSVEVRYGAVDSSKMFDCWGNLDSSMFMMECYTEIGSIRIQYESSDGLTYTRTDTTGNPVDFGTEIYYAYPDYWNDAIGKFIQVGGKYFDGLFSYGKDSKHISFIPVSSVSIDISNGTCAVTGPALDKVYDMEILKNIIKNNHSDYNGYVYNFYIRNNELYCCRSSEAMLNNMYYIIDRYFYDGTTFTPCMRRPSSSATLNEYKIDYDNQTIIEHMTYTSATVHTSTVVTYAGFTMDTLAILYWPDSFGPEHDTNTTYFYPNSWNDIMSENVTNYSYGLTWLVAPNQLDVTTNDVYKKEFYGRNGIEVGTLGTNLSNTFADVNAELAYSLQQQYENMEPRVLTNEDKEIDTNIYFIPVKKDGTPLLDTSAVTVMDHLFFECANLIELPLIDTSNAINMSVMFQSCSNLVSVPLLNTSKVIAMNSMFSVCEKLASVPLFDTSNVTNMSYMLSGCASLTSIPEFNTSKVKNMERMLVNCTNLITIPILNTTSVTNMSYIVAKCPALSETSLNNILQMCINATAYTATKTLATLGLTQTQATTCTGLSNYQAFLDAGWTTGY